MVESEKLGGTSAGVLKQYELLAGIYDSEMSRFWTRFNIFVGMEFAGLIALIINPEFVVANSEILFSVLLFCSLFSLLVVLTVIRSISSARLFPKLFARIEAERAELAEFMALVKKLDPLPQYVNFVIALVIAALFSLLWWCAFIIYGLGILQLEVPQ